MKWGRLILLITTLAWIQGYGLGSFTAPPQLLLAVVACIGLTGNLSSALAAGLIGGFWLDVAGNLTFGTHMLWYVGLAFGLWGLKRFGFEFERSISLLLTILVTVLLYDLWLLVWSWLGIGSVIWPTRLLGLWLVSAAITALLVLWWRRGWQKRALRWGLSDAQTL